VLNIKGTMNKARQEVVDLAFKKFDRDGNGTIDMSDVRYPNLHIVIEQFTTPSSILRS